MSPSQIIRLILEQIRIHQIKAGEKVIIQVTWEKHANHGLKLALREYWKVTPTIEGSKNLQTLSLTVVPKMLAAATT